MERNGGMVEGVERASDRTLMRLRDWGGFAQDRDIHQVLWPRNALRIELWQRRRCFQWSSVAARAVGSGPFPKRKHGLLGESVHKMNNNERERN